MCFRVCFHVAMEMSPKKEKHKRVVVFKINGCLVLGHAVRWESVNTSHLILSYKCGMNPGDLNIFIHTHVPAP